jgi:hypothetical protein
MRILSNYNNSKLKEVELTFLIISFKRIRSFVANSKILFIYYIAHSYNSTN